jgi:hypothetical protein
MKKCPPGVICIESLTLILIFIIILVVSYFIYMIVKKEKVSYEIIQSPNYPYNNFPVKDVLLNPYVAPYKDERYLVPQVSSVPINVSTNIGAVDTTYRQLGILTPLNGVRKDNILPIMGRPLFTSRDKWQYYTISNQHNNVKLPISVKGRSALTDYGVDQVYNGDTVYVEGYEDAFKVTMYENDTIKYLPYI